MSNVLEVMSPHGQGAGASRATKVVMTSVANDEANVFPGSECDSLLNIFRSSSINSIPHVIAEFARSLSRLERVATLVGKKWGHDR
jgi:hypothetical protein